MKRFSKCFLAVMLGMTFFFIFNEFLNSLLVISPCHELNFYLFYSRKPE